MSDEVSRNAQDMQLRYPGGVPDCFVDECAELKRLRRDNEVLRRLLWVNHGCNGLYGDDGEMQCGHCRIDFKRLSVPAIEAMFEVRAFRTRQAAMKSEAEKGTPG